MKNIKSLFIVTALVLSALPLMAQQKRVSPHETVSTVIDKNRVTITYGRPYTKDPKTGEAREIWGSLVPYGKVWRTGADEATILITQKAIMFGDTAVPAGAYTLWTLPNEDGTPSSSSTSKSANGASAAVPMTKNRTSPAWI